MAFYVYMLASKRNGTLYTGMTDNLVGRVWQHKEGIIPGFTREYGVKHLSGSRSTILGWLALTRERQIKKWNRAWKVEMIERDNTDWKDLSDGLGP